ncbi:MAG TPA: hypothetical protein VGM56_11860 [Byssovorax sp.]|jgi:hypothetical protein
MRRLASLGFLVVVLGCTDNSHPGALPNEVPNDAGAHFGAGQSATIASTGTGFGGFGGSTGASMAVDDCTCVASYNDNPACQTCWNAANSATCLGEFDICFDDVTGQSTCPDVLQCIRSCGTDYTCQKTCFLASSNPDVSFFNAYLSCVCTACESVCTEPVPLDCSIPPSTSASSGSGGFGP